MRISKMAAALDRSSGPKRCTGPCGRSFPRTTRYFYRSPGHSDGLDGWCKDCRRARNRLNGERWRAERRAAQVEQRPPANTAHRASPRLDVLEGRCQAKGCAHDAGPNGRFCTIPHHPRLVGVSVVFAEARACYPTGEA